MKIVVDEMPIWPNDCLFCSPNGECLLQNIIYDGNLMCGLMNNNCSYLTIHPTYCND